MQMVQMQMMGMMGGFSMGVEMLQQMGQMGESMSNKVKGIEIDEVRRCIARLRLRPMSKL